MVLCKTFPPKKRLRTYDKISYYVAERSSLRKKSALVGSPGSLSFVHIHVCYDDKDGPCTNCNGRSLNF